MEEAMKNSPSLRNLIDLSQPMLDSTSKLKEIEPNMELLVFFGLLLNLEAPSRVVALLNYPSEAWLTETSQS